jgi:hypothetical protein
MAVQKRRDAGPEVLRFTARLERRPKPANGAALAVPKAIGNTLLGMEKVEGTINDHPFRASLEWDPSGSCRLHVNDAMRNGAGARIGDAVRLAVLGPEPEPVVPADLRSAFAVSKEAAALWNDLATLPRRDWIRWIESAKTPETRARRVTRTIEQLSEGKRRPCCVNVYEFMLSRVRE